MSDKKDKKGLYSAVPTQEDDLALTQSFQPPPYTPSAPTSPFIDAHQAVAGPSSHVYNAAPPQPYQQPYQQPYHQSSYQQPHPQSYQPPHQHAKIPNTVPHPAPNTPLILMSPPCKIEDLKAKPAVVVCQHCSYLVLTETTPENGSCTYVGILGLLLLGVTSCGCCLLPLCITSCKDIMHSCPNCHEDIGLYSRIKERTFRVRPI
ncbi:MAG: LITAF-like zinc ribbon domain-containing protein [Benniella sp.]|nr:MAG: LITAF-like zinc ribbon domain-containing protein [Benniella sp.]